mmetsp:Transcript_47259/g.112296  ORF Transcript_47259/g.112296 Transcript_47259/m.112296 type:complete len:309 (-) Transcript_47259:1374-2300(-)
MLLAFRMSSLSSSAPSVSAMVSTQRRKSCQKVNASLRSSTGCTQQGKRLPTSAAKLSASFLYSKKYRTTIPMQARGSIKVGSSAGTCGYESLCTGDAHMKPLGNNLTLAKSFSRTDAKAPSTICRRVRLRTRTRAWKAAKSKSTSESHMMFLTLMGTKDMTRQRSSIPQTLSFSAPSSWLDVGYFTSDGKGLSGCAASNGSPLSWPYFMSSSAVRHGSVRFLGVSLRTSLRTVAPPSSAEIKSNFSKTRKCTKALKEWRWSSKDGGCGSLMPCMSGPSCSNSRACQFKQNLKSTLSTFWRLISAFTDW